MGLFVAREPIFDRSCEVSAYELLFRPSRRAPAGGKPPSLDQLTGGKPGFVSFTLDLPADEVSELLASGLATIRVPGYVDPKPAVVDACRKLKQAGYRLAMDDAVARRAGGPMLELADVVRVDFFRADAERRRSLVETAHSHGAEALAGPVQSHEELEEVLEMGYDYLEGYFFTKPDVRHSKEIAGSRLVYLRMLGEIAQPTLDYDKAEELIKRDVSLTFKLLEFMNSAWFGFRSEVGSIRHALVLLGPREVRKWFLLTAMRYMGSDKPDELVIRSLIRARGAELLAPELDRMDSEGELFLAGMFSLMDALLDRPMEEVLDALPLDERIRSALLGSEGPLGPALDLVLAYEAGWWDMFSESAAALNVDEARVAMLFNEARRWADEAFASLE